MRDFARRILRRLAGRLFGKLNEILQPIYQHRMAAQLVVIQAIPRTLVDYTPVHYYGRDEYLAPVRPENIDDYKFLHIHYQPQAIPKPYFFFITNATVHDVEIYDPQNPKRLFLENDPELTTWDNRLHKIRIVQRWLAMRHSKTREIDLDEAYVFSNRAWNNYYHFLFDSCIKYVRLESIGAITKTTKLIIHCDYERLLPWQKQYIELLGIDVDRFVTGAVSRFHTARKPLNVARLLVASSCRQRLACSPDAIETFETRLRTSLGLIKPHRPRWLYVRRKKSSSRHIANDDEISAFLHSRGFDSVELEGVPVVTQIQLFYETEVVVAAHGAALANLIHCFHPPNVVELIPRDCWTFGYYLHLATGLGGTHQAVLGTTVKSDGGYTVDVQAIANCLTSVSVLNQK